LHTGAVGQRRAQVLVLCTKRARSVREACAKK
jgi:hypothetical protein